MTSDILMLKYIMPFYPQGSEGSIEFMHAQIPCLRVPYANVRIIFPIPRPIAEKVCSVFGSWDWGLNHGCIIVFKPPFPLRALDSRRVSGVGSGAAWWRILFFI
jgi:hypothetical protein